MKKVTVLVVLILLVSLVLCSCGGKKEGEQKNGEAPKEEEKAPVSYTGETEEFVVKDLVVVKVPVDLKTRTENNIEGHIGYLYIEKEGEKWEATVGVYDIANYAETWERVKELDKETFGISPYPFTFDADGYFFKQELRANYKAKVNDEKYVNLDITGEEFEKAVADELIDYVLQNMTLK